MSDEGIWIRGELYLSLEVVAEVYEVQVTWLREVVDAGVLGDERARSGPPRIAAALLDRVAAVVRLHRTIGLDVDAIALWLASAPSR